MLTEFRLPELGENVTSGTIAKLLVAPGDQVAVGQNVLEIETDKAVAEIPCPISGKITEIRVKEGGKVKSGDVILVLDTASAATPPPEPAPKPVPAATGQKAKPTAAVTSRERTVSTPAPAPAARQGIVRAAPSVRQLAREHDVDINQIPVADPGGKATAQDILAFVAARESSALTPAKAMESDSSRTTEATWSNGEGTSVIQDKWGVVVQEAMSTIRSRGAERLTDSWQQIPHVTHFDKADITDLEALRNEVARKAQDKGARLTTMAFILKAIPEVLKRFPTFNASVDMERRELLLKRYYNIGFAVDTPNGLVVPVLREPEMKSILDIALEMAELARKAKERKLTLEEMQGGTFTISNLGGLGGYGFTPIINAPEVAILGLSRSQVEPVYKGDEFVPRTMLPMSLSYDHRIIDGADAARFMRYLAEAIEQPWRLMMGL